ncbi:hypothetical protein GTW43_14630 [Streptomyces sp. SID5785]|uniref:hypothetical protein n=1 Tax=Streptomyces sp. SID5785 TaxID=2690309 RepID=UPI0013612FFF|nr:hypothetical protein [Streptomyces sp. SID5785]MZD06320.1 hypothetical protein [Streptomyces sp. SID5785]
MSASTAERRGGARRAVALFFLAPLVGEYLLGNTPVTEPFALLLFAPMYGGGAVLIHEAARRTGRGWPTMLVLAAAYALLEEGPVDMMLWNPVYGGFDIGDAYAGSYVPGLGTSLQLLQDSLTLHTVWSICVPIALVEAWDARSGPRPWLGGRGTVLVGAVFLLGVTGLCAMQIAGTGFVASPAQFAWSGGVIVALVVLAFRLGRRPAVPRRERAPRPVVVAAAALAVTSVYWLRDLFLGEDAPWLLCGAWCAVVAGCVALGARWARAADWGPAHRLALAGGALLTYVWSGPVTAVQSGTPVQVALAGGAALGAGALWILYRGRRTAGAAAGTPGLGGDGAAAGAGSARTDPDRAVTADDRAHTADR